MSVTILIIIVSIYAVIRAMRWLYPRRFVTPSSQRFEIAEALRKARKREAYERMEARLEQEERNELAKRVDQLRKSHAGAVSCPWCGGGNDDAHVCEWPRGAA